MESKNNSTVQLAKYQKDIVKKMYTLLLEKDTNHVMFLFGDPGSGKTTITQGLIEELKEGWSIFYLEGISETLSPYLTWHIGTTLNKSCEFAWGGALSFGIPFSPTSLLNLEINTSYQKKDVYLTPNEEKILCALKKQIVGSDRVLFVADKYEFWDLPSKQLLQKIATQNLKLLDGIHIAFLIITRDNLSNKSEFPLESSSFSTKEICDNDIMFILKHQGYTKNIDIKKIRTCAGNNLFLAKMAADYYNQNKNVSQQDYFTILKKRYDQLPEEQQKACKMLGPLSIVDTCFSGKEASLFIEQKPENDIEAEFQAIDYLDIAQKQSFISGNCNYVFVNCEVKEFFNRQISRKKALYHRKFSKYLQINYSADYFNRGQHMMHSLYPGDTHHQIEAWQLLFLAYLRRSNESAQREDLYHIFPDIETLISNLPEILRAAQNNTFQKLKSGYDHLATFNYHKALFDLSSITETQLICTCKVEIKRSILLCLVQLSESPSQIKQKAAELYNLIEDPEFCEDEQYCRAALVLLDIYSDYNVDSEKCSTLKRKFIKIVQAHIDQADFQEFDACYNRKSALFYSAPIAVNQTEQSSRYYQLRQDRLNLYMALCNHSGNAIICGKYDQADQALLQCQHMLNDTGVHYPSSYKVENNRCILNFMKDEQRFPMNYEELKRLSEQAATMLKEIMTHQKDEVSHVVLLNYLSMLIFSNQDGWQAELEQVNDKLQDIDVYYQYFLSDLNFGASILLKKFDKAEKALNHMKNLSVPLLKGYDAIFQKRRNFQLALLQKQVEVDTPFMYHSLMRDNSAHTQDASSCFWGRGFLLSDMQFLSL